MGKQFFMLKRILLCSFTVFFANAVFSQQMQKPSDAEISNLPEWAKLMYSESPNILEVDALYSDYYRTNPFVKTYHTQFYKRWRRQYQNQINENGYIQPFSTEEAEQIRHDYLQKQSNEKASNWSVVGPLFNTEGNGSQGSGQANIYSIDQCLASPNVLFAGTEPGEVYKSDDGGLNWSCVTMSIDFGSGVSAIEVHPGNPDIAFAGGNLGLFRTTDGGSSWTNVLPQTNFNVNEILINPTNDQIVLVASDKGLYRSTNGGANWTQLYTQKTWDIKLNTGNANVVYMVKNNPSLIICEFFRSNDMGATWTLQSNGWYSSTDPARNDGGARIAVTSADPNRVYAYLIGESKADDYGYIGVYKSIDGGSTWTLPNGPTGGPYTSAHPNLAYGYPSWTYHQGFYNCAITASSTNPDHILIGGLNLWRSNDGGVTFSSVAGYVGGPHNIHVDMQDFRQIGNTTWITTDGGIYRSEDFCVTQPQFRMNGLHGSDYWGFGSGWNEDILVGGLYHNGNLAHHESYGQGVFLELGGGEAPTGYVNPGNNRKTYFSDIQGATIPIDLNDPIQYFSIGMSPNESYWAAESSEMEFHPNCYSTVWLGKDNKLWKSTDAGGSYNLVYTFGSSIQNRVKYIEVASTNPDVIYLNQQPSSGSAGILWKTTNGGVSWQQLTIPAGNSRRMLLTIDPKDEDHLWIAYPSGSNGNKVFETTNGGSTWTNITGAILNNESIQSIVHVAGTNGTLYAGTSRAVYYRNEAGSWSIDNVGLPTYTNVNILRPFYRDGKIRLASYGKGIWQSPLNEQPSLPVARIMVDKLSQSVICAADSFYFEDHSFLNHNSASWYWSFPTGSPNVSNERNPAVFFSTPGTHLAILAVTDGNGNIDVDSLYVTVSNYAIPSIINEDFQGNFFPEGWTLSNYDNGGQWSLSTSAGGFGNSSQSTIFDNYNIDSQGTYDDLNITLNTLTLNDLSLTFDVAYAPYGGQYSDSLKVMVSTDCGLSFDEVYFKGGTTLGTTPANSDLFVPNSDQWRNETVDLSSYSGFEKVIIAFRNKGHWGNALYIDNVNIQGELSVLDISRENPEIYPNPVSCGGALNVKWEGKNMRIRMLDNSGKLIGLYSVNGESTIEVPEHLNSGLYWLNIETDDQIKNLKFVVR